MRLIYLFLRASDRFSATPKALMSRLREVGHATFLAMLLAAQLVFMSGCTKPDLPDPSKTQLPAKTDSAELIVNKTAPRWVYQNQPHAKAAVVFIHGIFGDTMGTWTNANGRTFFDILRKDPKLEAAVDMFAFGYTSEMFKGGSLDVDEAATKLNEYLKREKINDYPAIVFVAHSMGGLVTLRHLLAQREQLAKVPVIALFGTPQAGAQVANIAKLVVKNDALMQMVPGNQDAYLRNLDKEWRSIAASNRPVVRCGYEKKETFGVMIVPWDTATRFCDGAAMAIPEDHLGLVKPAGPDSDSVVLLVNALNEFVVGKNLAGKLETPDFVRVDDQLVFNLKSAYATDNARLINVGKQPLKYVVAQVSDHGLIVLPADTPRELQGNERSNLQFLLAYGATQNEYTFVLRTEIPSETPTEEKITIKVANMGAVAAQQAKLAEDLSAGLNTFVSNPERMAAWRKPGTPDSEVHDAIVQETRRIVSEKNPALPEVAQWVVSTELLNAFNWPNLGQRALSNVERVSPASLKAKGIQRLAEVTRVQSGQPVFEKSPRPVGGELLKMSPSVTPFKLPVSAIPLHADNPLARPTIQASTMALATQMQTIPALKPLGLSLRADVQLAQGDKIAAHTALAEAANMVLSPSPSIQHRIAIASPDLKVDSKTIMLKPKPITEPSAKTIQK